MNGAPTIAPIATSSAAGSSRMSATIGIADSGSAVETPASRVPTAPTPSPSRLPAHSTAFVKSSAPARTAAKPTISKTTATPYGGDCGIAVGGTITQGHGDFAATAAETLPRTADATPPRPLEPSTTNAASSSAQI